MIGALRRREIARAFVLLGTGPLRKFRCVDCGAAMVKAGGNDSTRCDACMTAWTADSPYRRRRWRGGIDAAHAAVASAIRRGGLPPVTTRRCVDCGGPAEHYDHRDYGRPLDVEPTCRICNFRRGPGRTVPGKG